MRIVAARALVAIARGWVGGAGAIRRLVAQVLGDAPATPAAVDDAPVTEPHSLVSLPTVAEPTRPARRLARGTAAEHADDDELDERTRGRAPLRRPSWLHLAA